jgi:hypothetical protein
MGIRHADHATRQTKVGTNFAYKRRCRSRTKATKLLLLIIICASGGLSRRAQRHGVSRLDAGSPMRDVDLKMFARRIGSISAVQGASCSAGYMSASLSGLVTLSVGPVVSRDGKPCG